MHPATLPLDELQRNCRLTFRRRSGPGGQHRNKVETAVVVQHLPTGVEGQASERRSQMANRKLALWRLRVNLALQIRTGSAWEGQPSAAWRERCRHGRITISPLHEDFPALLAEALDAVAWSTGDVKAAATQLTCTSSQLIGLLALEPRALAQVNAQRRAAGQRPLHEPG